MGTSYVEFIGKGYWTHDAFLEGLSYLLAREFSKLENKEKWQIDLIERWTDAATAGFVGCVPSSIKYFDTHDKVQLLRATLINILNQLSENENYLTVTELNENKVGQGGWNIIDVKRLINIVQLTFDLIDGKLKTDASSPIDYWNLD